VGAALGVPDGVAEGEALGVPDGVALGLVLSPGVAGAVADGSGVGVAVSPQARLTPPPSTLRPIAPVTAQAAVERVIFMVDSFFGVGSSQSHPDEPTRNPA